jgi:O-methyltransferase involved in polyketide biosynthesis
VSRPDAISPTAHYTGHVWYRHGLSHPALATREGRLLFDALAPAMRIGAALGAPSLEEYLLARHWAIDALLETAIARDGASQVLEVAAGLSPRGWRFTARHGAALTYVEADLPAMADRKRAALAAMGSLSEHHRVVALDVLREAGPDSLPAIAAGLAPDRGLVIITEGLLGYLPTEAVDGLWRRVARELSRCVTGRYLADLHLGSAQSPTVRAFRVALAAFVRGRVYLHFDGAAQAEAALRACGFSVAAVRPAAQIIALAPRGEGTRAHIIEASTG